MNAAEALLKRLKAGEFLLLDGATGSELHRRGVNVSFGASSTGGSGAWASIALETAPEVLRAVHEDYLCVGADIVTANSYATNPGRLRALGLEHKSSEWTRRAAVLAREARDRIAPGAFVAGSVALIEHFPSGWDPVLLRPYDERMRDWRAQVAILAESGVDAILIESMNASAHFLPAVEAARTSDLPVLLGLKVGEDGRTVGGETMAETVAALSVSDLSVDAALLMCSAPEDISRALPALRDAFAGPIGAYANIGYRRNEEEAFRKSGQFYGLETGENTPTRYAEFTIEWRRMGAQIIGGCCGTTPEHIGVIRSSQ